MHIAKLCRFSSWSFDKNCIFILWSFPENCDFIWWSLKKIMVLFCNHLSECCLISQSFDENFTFILQLSDKNCIFPWSIDKNCTFFLQLFDKNIRFLKIKKQNPLFGSKLSSLIITYSSNVNFNSYHLKDFSLITLLFWIFFSIKNYFFKKNLHSPVSRKQWYVSKNFSYHLLSL